MSFLDRHRVAASKSVVDLTKDSKSTLAPPSPSPSIASTTSALNGPGATTPKKKRPADGVEIYSQPALTGTGMHLGTQMVYAVNHLKEKDRNLSVSDIVDHLSRRPANDAELAEIVEALRRHPRVKWTPDPALAEQTIQSGTYAHNPVIPGVKTKDTLLQYLQSKKDAMAVTVKDLEDGWPKERLYPAIAELEKEHNILVVRTKKDNAPRYIWQDDASLWNVVEPTFQVMWHKVNVPTVEDINRLLLQAGQRPTSEDPRNKMMAKVEKAKPKKKKKAPRNLTNTHLKGHLSMFKDL